MDITFCLLCLGYGASVAAGTLTPAFSWIFGRISNAFGSGGISAQVNESVMYLFILSLVSLLFISLSHICVMRGAIRRSRTLTVRSVTRLLELPPSSTRDNVVVEVMVEQIPLYMEGIIQTSNLLRHGTTALAGLAVSCTANGRLTGYLIAVVVPSIVAISFGSRCLSNAPEKALAEADSRSQMVIRECLTDHAFGAVQTLSLKTHFVDSYGEKILNILRPRRRLLILHRVSDTALTALAFCLGYGLCVYMGGLQVADGKTSPGDVLVVLFASLSVGWSAGQLLPALNKTLAGRKAMNRVEEACQLKHEVCACVDEPLFLPETGVELVLRDIGGRGLRNISFICPPNARLCLVGRSGCGKSTILSMICGFVPHDHGSIVLGGIDLTDVPIAQRSSVITFIPQEVVLFRASVYENVALATGASLSDVIKACQRSHAHAFITKLPQGYDTLLTEASLSGGQRQRIGIARAFVRGGSLWLLDEWSSALDSATERLISEELARVQATVLEVAHRATRIQGSDVIVVLSKEGRVVGNGPHEDLVHNNDEYRQLINVPEDFDDDKSPDEAPIISPLRTSVLSRNSVRLSIMPDSISLDDKSGQMVQNRPEFMKGVEADRRIQWLHSGFNGLLGVQNTAYAVTMGCVVASMISGESLLRFSLAYVIIGVGTLVVAVGGCLAEATLVVVGELRGRTKLFTAALDVPFVDKPQFPWTGILLLLAEVRALSLGYHRRRATIATLVCATIATCTAGFMSSWKVAAVTLSTGPLHVVLRWLEARIEATASADDQLISEANSIAIQAVHHVHHVKVLRYESTLIDRIDSLLQHNEANCNKRSAILGALAGLSSFAQLNTVAMSIWWGTRLLLAAQLDIRDLMVSFLAAYFLLCYDCSNLGRIFKGPDEQLEQQIDGLLRLSARVKEEDQKRARLLHVDGAISFRSVTFGFPNTNRLVLKQFNLEIAPRESVALVGESGHGKTCVLNLIAGFLSPAAGSVLLDGVDTTKLSQSFLGETMAYVGQVPAIFEGSILVNVLYGSRNKTREDAVEAAKKASLHDWVQTLDGGYDAECTALSGGQRARLALARALVSTRPITLLDEPTAGLDAETEAAVVSTVNSLVSSRTSTVICVAHRLQTVTMYDQIVCVYRGRVLERGSHDALLELGGYYQHLWATSGAF